MTILFFGANHIQVTNFALFLKILDMNYHKISMRVYEIFLFYYIIISILINEKK